VYDGASDGYDRAREANIQLDSDGFFHSSFILHSSATSKEYLAYTTSNDGLIWAEPIIALEVSGQNVLNDPTVDVDYVGSDKIVLITYLEGSTIKFVFTSDGGTTWSDPVDMSSGSDSLPDTCVTADGYVHSCWIHEETPGGDTRVEYKRAHFVEG
jgi:hypothetical protein